MKTMERTPVKRTHITHFAQELGQCEAAALLKMTQGALSKAIRRGRDVYVTKHADGSYTAEEVRSFPSQSPTKNQPPEAVAV
ncbi:Cro/CI family transcriptional regulator [Pseudomonas lundensis]|uniref:Cro/CI family transcriptional regulator n=1 Tax=Pseudomonas lundensis TaxID=86185 RepID=UPI003AB92028